MRGSRSLRGIEASTLGLQSRFHTMKRDGICFGCGAPTKTGDEVYRIDMLAGKSKYINLCNKCQTQVMSDIMGRNVL